MNRKTLTVFVVLAAFFLSLSLLLAFFPGLFPRFVSPQTFTSNPLIVSCYNPAISLSKLFTMNAVDRANTASSFTLKELSESFLCIGLLCLVFPILKAPGFLKRKLALPKPARYTLGLIAIGGLLYFLREEVLDIMIMTGSVSLFYQYYYLGPNSSAYAVVGLGVATLCIGLLTVGKGLSTGLKSAVLFGSFWVLVAQICIYHYDYIQMCMHVTTSVENWAVFGFPVLSNWFCLIVAGGLFVLSLASFHGPGIWRVGET
jgi:hypothetical protein